PLRIQFNGLSIEYKGHKDECDGRWIERKLRLIRRKARGIEASPLLIRRKTRGIERKPRLIRRNARGIERKPRLIRRNARGIERDLRSARLRPWKGGHFTSSGEPRNRREAATAFPPRSARALPRRPFLAFACRRSPECGSCPIGRTRRPRAFARTP